MKRLILSAAFALSAATPALADDVTDTLQSAIEAYESGDVQYALEELAYAQQLLRAMKAEGLTAYLPPAPEGWSREVNTDMNQGLAMMGGGTGAEAVYSGNGASFTVTLMADNPMVGAMGAMFASPMLMAAGGEIIRVGRQKFVDQDGELTALVDSRILVQASGADADTMLPVLEAIDYKALAGFGR
ncbi:hypothetical protein [Rhodovulum adriaticum]|uniref:Uncharacterized protein n=1 Tax=Rhodovulum adriaticum TaxID=35804 RepID=A0A4R2NYG6_RHOAD|nr:hypothetical protein [Rhodovulum adriaticum]MBK1634300.1 hypothetical protein [Rhodovulum adriaticum]TCP27147.1 hypothetical protein EV656_10150 [Rhodovulum adriaticum]